MKAVGRAVKRRYTTRRGMPKMGKIARDAALGLRAYGMLNAEKKRYTINTSATPLEVGQVDDNASGHLAVNPTPIPAQGLQYNNRIGSSIKVTSIFFRIQFWQQPITNQPIRLKIYLVKVLGEPQSSASGALTNFFLPNPFVTGGSSIYDFNSSTNPDFYPRWRVLRKKVVRLQADTSSSQTQVKDVSMSVKFKKGHHVRFSQNSTTVTNGQLLLFVLADCGNTGGNPSTLTGGVPVLSANTGAFMAYDATAYYYDN